MKSKLLMGVLVFIFITFSTFLLFFLLGRNHKPEGAGQSDQEETDTVAIDYSELDISIKEVPEYYTVFFDKKVASHLSDLLNYVKENKETMTQESVDAYAKEITEIIKATYSSTDMPQVYIIANDEEVINREYSSVSIAIVDSEGGKFEDIIDLTAEIKIRGNSTAEVAKKTYTIKFSEKVDVFGMGKAKKWVLNANAFDKSLLRNKLVFDFGTAIGLKYTPESTFTDVWLNGKFIGNYLLSEVIEASSSRVDINTDKGDFLIEREQERFSPGTTYFRTPIYGYRFGVNEPQDITQEQLTELTSFLGKVEMAVEDGNWELFTGYVDEKSYIDYYILSELFKEVDIDYSSTRFYIKNGKLYAGPAWDYDLSSGNADSDFYYDYNHPDDLGIEASYLGLWCDVNFYSYCYEFPEFKVALQKRYMELQEVIRNLYEDNSLGTNQIDQLLEKYKKSFDRNYSTAGWSLEKEFMLERNPETTYEQNVEYLREWLKKRNEFLLDYFE